MLLTVLLIFARESCTRTFVPKRDHLALTMLNVSPTWEYQSPPRLLSIGATLLSVQRCMCFGLSESTEATLYRCNTAIGATLHVLWPHISSHPSIHIYTSQRLEYPLPNYRRERRGYSSLNAACFTNVGVSVYAGYTLLVKQQQLPEQVVLQRFVPEGLGILGIL
jgi:hypothetical protein